MKEWALARGFEIIQESGAFIEIRIEIPCPHLKNGLCDIQNNKPEVCKTFPEGMAEFLISKGLDPNKSFGPACGFRYEE
jgi:Fe-S-cluster containining protein